jgi:hypothetical protein
MGTLPQPPCTPPRSLRASSFPTMRISPPSGDLIREALVADGVAETIERLVDALLPP